MEKGVAIKKNRALIIFGAVVLVFGVLTYALSKMRSVEINPDNFSGVRLAILDGEKLKASAKCFKAHEAVAKMFADVLSKMREMENQMKADYDTIKRNTRLSQSQKNKEIGKIETKWGTISTKYNAKIQAIRNLELNLTEKIQQELLSVVEAVAKEAKISAVINKGNREMISVFYASPSVDITEVVIKKLDEALPEIDIRRLTKNGR
ncbi:MAG: OmpH family outer membrane protein [Holosporales bacterium]|jgi:Skp family chaperone for outer membrane proteins|nr:OmpH family outer membrane protein [Holosporales bacterium]